MDDRRTLLTLYAVNFLNAIGGWFFLPLLPIFLGRRGGSATLVGLVQKADAGARGHARRRKCVSIEVCDTIFPWLRRSSAVSVPQAWSAGTL